MFQGTLESNLNEGAAVVRAYNALGYDAVAVGNHEFDFGPVGPGDRAARARRRSARRAQGARRRGPLPVPGRQPGRRRDRRAARLAERRRHAASLDVAGVKVGIIGLANAVDGVA